MTGIVGSIAGTTPRLLREILAERGADDGRLAREAGLDEAALSGTRDRVPAGPVLTLLENGATALADPIFGAHLGQDYRPGSLGLLDYLFLTSSTLRGAFDTAIRYRPISAAYGAYGWSLVGDRETVERRFPEGDAYRHAETFVLGWQLTMSRYATRRPIRPVGVGLTQPGPAGDLAAVFGVSRIEFGCATATLTLSPDDLDRPLPGADPLLAASLRRHADARRPAPVAWPDRVRAFLAAGFADRPVTLDAAARELAVSPRTLQQHLRDAGTTWQNELDAARNTLARELLRNDRLPVAAVAERVGYADARAFRRAFHRLNRCSPDQFRANGPR